MDDEARQASAALSTIRVAGCRRVLVDTSLLIEQQKRQEHAQPVREALAGYRFKGASSFSRLEFKYAWLQRLAYIYEITKKPSVRSTLDVLEWINNKLQGLNRRRGQVQTVFQALFTFLELDNGRIGGKAQLTRLRAHCKVAILDAVDGFEQIVTGEFKGTDCARAKQLAKERSDGSLDTSIRQCKRGRRECRVDDFFLEHRDLFTAISACIAAAEDPSPELQEIREHIQAAMKDPEHLRDHQKCRRIADAIIAVDGRDMEVFAANNDREWRTIASAMNKHLQNPVTGRIWPPNQ